MADDGLTVMCEVEHGGIAIEQITLAVPVPTKAEDQMEGRPDGEGSGFEFVLEMIDVEVRNTALRLSVYLNATLFDQVYFNSCAYSIRHPKLTSNISYTYHVCVSYLPACYLDAMC